MAYVYVQTLLKFQEINMQNFLQLSWFFFVRKERHVIPAHFFPQDFVERSELTQLITLKKWKQC